MPYQRTRRQPDTVKESGQEKEVTLLNITLGADDRIHVKSAFEKVKCSTVKNAMAESAADFVNECYAKSDSEAVSIREFIGLLEAAMISVCSEQVRTELMRNLATNVKYFERTMQRTN